MRVISGTAKGSPLIAVEGDNTRPILDHIKEALFSIISNSVVDANFIDLFAGTGGIGIEALSRGAAKCLFVDNDYRAVKTIKTNLEKSRLLDNSAIIKSDVLSVDNNSTFNEYLVLNNRDTINSGSGVVECDGADHKSKGFQFDVVMVGTPYILVKNEDSRILLFEFFKRFVEKELISSDGMFVFQHGKAAFDISREYKVKVFDTRTYGKTQLTFLRPEI